MGRVILHTFKGTRFTIGELADMSGVPAFTIYQHLSNGWTVEQAVTLPTPAQRRRGVVSNFPTFSGTGAGSTAQETPEITFPKEANC